MLVACLQMFPVCDYYCISDKYASDSESSVNSPISGSLLDDFSDSEPPEKDYDSDKDPAWTPFETVSNFSQIRCRNFVNGRDIIRNLCNTLCCEFRYALVEQLTVHYIVTEVGQLDS